MGLVAYTSGIRVQGSGFRVQGGRFRVYWVAGLEFRIEGEGCRVYRVVGVVDRAGAVELELLAHKDLVLGEVLRLRV